jgi:hypothetical protein
MTSASSKTYTWTPKLHFYLVPTHSYNYFRFRGRRASRYVEFMPKYTELHVVRRSIDFGVLENLYLDAEITFLSRTDAYLLLLPVSLSTFGAIPVVHMKHIISKRSACYGVVYNLRKAMIFPLELHVFQSPASTYIWLPFIVLHVYFRLNGWSRFHVISIAVSGILENIKIVIILVIVGDLQTRIMKNQTPYVFRQKSTYSTLVSGDVTWYPLGIFRSRYHHPM